MRNDEVIRLFIAGDRHARSSNGNLWIRAWAQGTDLMNYKTPIARKGGSWVDVATKKYSRTTSKIHTQLRAQLRNAHLRVAEVEEIE